MQPRRIHYYCYCWAFFDANPENSCPVRVFHPADRCLQNPSQLCTGCCFPYVRAVRWVPGTVVLAACAPRICVRSCDTAQVHNVKSLLEWGCRPRNRQVNAKKARAVAVQRPTRHQSSSSSMKKLEEEEEDIRKRKEKSNDNIYF